MGIGIKKSQVLLIVMMFHFTCWEGKKTYVFFLNRDTCAERKKLKIVCYKKNLERFFLVGSRIAEQLMQESWSKFFYTLGEHCTIPPPPPDRDEQRPQLLPAAQAAPFQQPGMSSAPSFSQQPRLPPSNSPV